MGLKRTTNPASEPVTTSEAKTHARISTSSDDSYIGTLITAARETVENLTGRALINQSWTLTLRDFPCKQIIIPINPLSSVTSISYVDTSGATQTWSSANYTVDTSGEIGRIEAGYGITYPSTRDVVNAVTVVFVAGYGASASAVPEVFKQAIKMLVGHWYLNRGEMGSIPDAVLNLIGAYRLIGAGDASD